jgi:hypothetical protein
MLLLMMMMIVVAGCFALFFHHSGVGFEKHQCILKRRLRQVKPSSAEQGHAHVVERDGCAIC